MTATDMLEHLTKPEVLDTFDRVANTLMPGAWPGSRMRAGPSPGGFASCFPGYIKG